MILYVSGARDSMLSENLKKARKISGYSQDEVATRLKITRQSISKWENGHAYPDVISLKLLCDLYNISMDEIVKDDEVICKKEKEVFADNVEAIEYKNNWNSETMFVLVLTIVSCLIPCLGIAVSLFYYNINMVNLPYSQ